MSLVAERVALDIAGRTVAVATHILAVGIGHILAGLLHGTLDSALLHVAVGRDLRLDVVALENQGQRHPQNKQPIYSSLACLGVFQLLFI